MRKKTIWLINNFRIFFASLFLLMTGVTSVSALSLSPMYLNMAPNGMNSRAVVTFSNTSPKPMPVKASLEELILGSNGEQNKNLDTSSFLIFPPQAIIPPHGKQTFRIQWRGQPNLPQGKTYSLTVFQVLAEDSRIEKIKERKIEAKIAIGFGAIITMQAAQGSPRPVVKSTHLARDTKGKLVVDSIIGNQSNQNFLLVQADSLVTVYNANKKQIWSYTYTPGQMMRNFGLGIVQPQKNRRIKLPLNNIPDHIARQAKSVKLEIRPSVK